MHRKSVIFITVVIVFAAAYQAFAAYYTIRLKNGKEIAVNKYWDEGGKIRFYRDGGSVSIAKEDIQSIGKQSGEAPIAEQAGSSSTPVPEITENPGEDNSAPPPLPAAKTKENEQAEIKERLDIIKSNIATFNERKNTYLKQKNAAQEVKVKAEQRIDKNRVDTYMTSEDRRQSIASEELKITNAEMQIREADRQISAIEEMINNQEAIKKNLEDRMQQP
jgi:hypothetical protein